jgi:hypothetical protein
LSMPRLSEKSTTGELISASYSTVVGSRQSGLPFMPCSPWHHEGKTRTLQREFSAMLRLSTAGLTEG